jgi:hypothetical protein
LYYKPEQRKELKKKWVETLYYLTFTSNIKSPEIETSQFDNICIKNPEERRELKREGVIGGRDTRDGTMMEVQSSNT